MYCAAAKCWWQEISGKPRNPAGDFCQKLCALPNPGHPRWKNCGAQARNLASLGAPRRGCRKSPITKPRSPHDASLASASGPVLMLPDLLDNNTNHPVRVASLLALATAVPQLCDLLEQYTSSLAMGKACFVALALGTSNRRLVQPPELKSLTYNRSFLNLCLLPLAFENDLLSLNILGR